MSSAEQRLEKIVRNLTVWKKGRAPSFAGVLAYAQARVNRRRPRSEEIARVDNSLRAAVSAYGWSDDDVNRISDAVVELLTNGFDHSRDQRFAIRVDLFMLEPPQVVVCIRDHGARFELKAISPKMPEWRAAHGRGLAIVQLCADDFGSNDDGSLLLLVFRKTLILPSELRHV